MLQNSNELFVSMDVQELESCDGGFILTALAYGTYYVVTTVGVKAAAVAVAKVVGAGVAGGAASWALSKFGI